MRSNFIIFECKGPYKNAYCKSGWSALPNSANENINVEVVAFVFCSTKYRCSEE